MGSRTTPSRKQPALADPLPGAADVGRGGPDHVGLAEGPELGRGLGRPLEGLH